MNFNASAKQLAERIAGCKDAETIPRMIEEELDEAFRGGASRRGRYRPKRDGRSAGTSRRTDRRVPPRSRADIRRLHRSRRRRAGRSKVGSREAERRRRFHRQYGADAGPVSAPRFLLARLIDMGLKVIVERDALFRALRPAHRAARGHPTIPILNHVCLRVADQLMHVEGTNLHILVDGSLPADVETSGGITVSAERLFRLVDNFPEGSDVTLSEDSGVLTVVCGRARATLPTLPEIDWPRLTPNTDPVVMEMDAAAVRRAFAFCKDCVADPNAHQAFAGIRLSIEDGQLQAMSYSGKEFAILPFWKAPGDVTIDVTIPGPNADAIAEILPKTGVVTISFGDRVVTVTAPGMAITSKLLDTSWPAWRQLITRSTPDFTMRVAPSDLLGALDRVAAATDGESVHLGIETDRLCLHSRGNGELAKSRAWGVVVDDQIAAAASVEASSGAWPHQLRAAVAALLLTVPAAEEMTIEGCHSLSEPLRLTVAGKIEDGLRLMMPCDTRAPTEEATAA